MINCIHPTYWPAGFQPDNPNFIIQGAIVDRCAPPDEPTRFHSHQSGQLAISLTGLVGLTTAEGRSALPAGGAVWTPPGFLHEGFLGKGAVSLYLMVREDWAAMLPGVPFRILTTPLIIALTKRFVGLKEPYKADSHNGRLARVLLDEILLARRLPLHFAPLPCRSALEKAAEALALKPTIATSETELAAQANMSTRNFSRLIVRETGLSFREWRLRLVMLAASRLIMEGETVEKTAFAVGYETSSAFVAAFRRIFNMTPGAYRRQSGSPK